MDMGHDEQNQVESGAMHAMQPGHHMDGPHMHMTALRPVRLATRARGTDCFGPAANDGKIPRLSSGARRRLSNFSAELAAKRIPFHELLEWLSRRVYVRPRATDFIALQEDSQWRLGVDRRDVHRAADGHARSIKRAGSSQHGPVARAHQSLLAEARRAAHMDLAKFGLSGTIATAQACKAAGGRFFPQIFGWMVHVYPFDPPNQIWAQ